MKNGHEGAAGTSKTAKAAITSSAKRPTRTAQDPGKIADFILFSQREFLLNLLTDMKRGSVTFAQYYVLQHLAKSQDVCMTDIARKMGHSTAAATGLVDRLEKLGYVERVHATDDRRKVLVRITAKGLELVSRLRDVLQQRVSEAMHESNSYDSISLLANYRGEQNYDK